MTDKHQRVLKLIGFRESTTRCSTSTECDVLLFIKNSLSFSILYEDENWPPSLCDLPYTRQTLPSLPPQPSLLIKNVGLATDFDQFTNELKTRYSDLQNVIQMKNKEQMNIKLVKLEFIKTVQRDAVLASGRIFVNSLSFEVAEYLAPARVQICSKCMGIGHFRKQYAQKEDTCRKCGENHSDIKEHINSCSKLRCVNCHSVHMSNDPRCPKVKQYRADLTRFFLASSIPANTVGVNLDPMFIEFPPLNTAQRPTLFNYPFNKRINNTTTNNSIDLVLGKLEDINKKIEKLTTKTENVEDGLNRIRKTMEELNVKMIDLTMDNSVIKEKFNNQERIIKDVIFLVVKLLINISKDSNFDHGRWKNADFGSQIEIYSK